MMKIRVRFHPLLFVVLVALTPKAGGGMDLMLGVVPSDGSTLFVKQFAMPAGTSIQGVEFRNNDARTVFPEVLCIRDVVAAISEGTVVARATNVSETSAGWVRVFWSQAVQVDQPSTCYLAVRIPAGPGKEGPGNGPALGATATAEGTGSFVAGGPDGELTPIRADLSLALITGIVSKAANSIPEQPARVVPRTFLGAANPASSVICIRFGVERGTFVKLAIYDIAGREVKRLVRDWVDAGEQGTTWDGRDKSGREVAAGVYFVRMNSGTKTMSQKIVLAK